MTDEVESAEDIIEDFKLAEELIDSIDEDIIKEADISISSQKQLEDFIYEIERKMNEMEQKQEQLKNLENRLNQKEDKINQVFEEVANRKEEIEEAQSEAKELKNIHSQLAQWKAGETIGGQFERRKQELKKSLRLWLGGSLVSIAILLGFSYTIYADISTGNGQSNILISKITLLLPASVAVWFFVTNYSRQKRLMREYEFKESMAVSFRGFLEMLREDMSEEERPQIGEFVVDTMNRIYSNPQENVLQSEEPNNQNQDQNGPLSQGAVAQILNRLGKR